MEKTMQVEVKAMAETFGVDGGALVCLLGFLKNKLSKPEVAQAFAAATPADQDRIIKEGVKAWHDQSVAVFSDLMEGRSEWAQAARQQIASDVWHQARAKGGAA